MSTNVDGRPRPRGRPLSDAVRIAVHAEALRSIAELAPAEVTLSGLAQRAGVSRQTLYNRWPTVPDLVLDALLEAAEDEVVVDADGGLSGYLTRLAGAVDGWARPGLRAIGAYAQSDQRFAARFRNEFLAVRHGRLVEALGDHLAHRGEAAPDLAERRAASIAASMWYRVLVTDEPLDRAWVDEMVAMVGA